MTNTGDARRIRSAVPSDRDALYDICVRTGDAGADATELYRYPELLGDVFVGPYLQLEPDLAFVVAGAAGPEGYILGALDTRRFDERCERQWWPGRRRAYADVVAGADGLDAWLLGWIAFPPATPAFAADYPSHLHIDLLPTAQGGGWGRRLVRTLCAALLERGSRGVHLGVGATNDKAIGFYRHLGFTDLEATGTTRWMGLSLEGSA